MSFRRRPGLVLYTTTSLRDLLEARVSEGAVPGAVALLARGEQVEVQAVGAAAVGGAVPMARDSIFRIASITKPITAAAVMMLVDDGRVALEDPVERWLPELASRVVVRTPAGPVDDVVPAVRPITVLDLLTSRAGYGWPSDFSLPAVADAVRHREGPERGRVARAARARPAALPAGRGVAVRHLLGPPGRPRRAGRAGSRCPSSSPSGSSSRSAWSTPASRCRRRSATG